MTIRELLDNITGKKGKTPFLYYRDQIVNFEMLDQKVKKAANLFRDLGVKKGDHVCLFLPNCPEFLYLWFGLAKVGGVMVPMNFRLSENRLAYIINHCNSKCIVLNDAFYDAFASAEKEIKSIKHKIWHSEGVPPPETFYSLNTLMESTEMKELPIADIKDGDPLAILYTYGTTGPPKGVMISQFNYINTGMIWAKDIISYREDDIIFSTLPLYLVNAQMFSAMSCLVSGHPYVLGERFSPANYFDEVRRYGATILHLVGSMVVMLMKQPEQDNDSNNPARIASSTFTPPEIWKGFEKRFNLTLLEGYGLTETGGVSLINPRDKIKFGSIGKPTCFCDVTIWDENNREVPIGINGEIVVKEKIPYSMFLGYFKESDKTEEVWKGDWFHTGDRGYKDEEGYFFYVDRIKDCIHNQGQNISSLEIETIVNSHPKVLESAAIGVFSELGDEDIKIYVVAKPEEKLEVEELIAFCDERMAYFMVPRYIEFVKGLPKNSIQKIDKLELRARGIGNAWDREKVGYKLLIKRETKLRANRID